VEHEPTSERLLSTLERLLELPAVDLKTTLSQAVQCLHEVLGAEKVDAFLHDPAKNALRAIGTSDTPLGQLQVAQGLDLLPVSNGGSIARVYTTGEPYITGHAEQDPDELPGIIQVLGVRSHIAVPITVAGERRGVLSAQSPRPEYFTQGDLCFLQAVGRWVGALEHRVELAVATAADAHQSGRRAAAEEIIAVLAHELRNHLAPLRYRLDMMLRRAQKEKRPADVRDGEQASRGLDRLASLVSDLLDAERLERGMLCMQPTQLDLVRLAQEVAQGLETAGVTVRLRGLPQLVLVLDEDRMRQVLENLVSNAIKHSPPGGTVQMEISAQILNESAQRVALVEVSDQGPGVPSEILPHIFERFVTAGNANGLGLGLYLASRIVAAHGGTLAVSSPPNQGARFRLTLPIEIVDR